MSATPKRSNAPVKQKNSRRNVGIGGQIEQLKEVRAWLDKKIDALENPDFEWMQELPPE